MRRPPVFRCRMILSYGVVGAVLFAAPTARATDFVWNNAAGGNWTGPGNWTPIGPPGSLDTATIDTAGTYTVTLNATQSITTATLNRSTATLSHTAGSFFVGSGGINLTAGTYSLNGGNISGGTITSGGGRLLPQANNGNFLTNVAVGAGVIDFSVASARLRLQGTTTLAAGTVLNMSNGGGIGSVLAFEQTTTANGLTVNLGPNTYLSVEGNKTLTLGPATTVTNASAGGTITGNLFLVGGVPTVVNQGLIRNTGTGSLSISLGAFTNQAGGTVRAESNTILIPGATSLTNFAGTNLTGGTWEVRGSATLNFDTRSIATLAAGTTVVFDGPTPTFASLNALTTNNGTLRVLGGKTFTPMAASVNTAGTLEVGAGSTFGKAVVVKSAGVLLGGGTVTGAVTAESGGAVSPGVGPAVLTINSNLALQPGSDLVVEVNGPAPGTQHDRLVVNGTVDLTGADLIATIGYAPPLLGDKAFFLVNDGVDPIVGEFNGLPNNALFTFADGSKANISYFGDSTLLTGTGGNDVVFYDIRPVPEPGSLVALAGLGLAAVGAWRRRHR